MRDRVAHQVNEGVFEAIEDAAVDGQVATLDRHADALPLGAREGARRRGERLEHLAQLDEAEPGAERDEAVELDPGVAERLAQPRQHGAQLVEQRAGLDQPLAGCAALLTDGAAQGVGASLGLSAQLGEGGRGAAEVQAQIARQVAHRLDVVAGDAHQGGLVAGLVTVRGGDRGRRGARRRWRKAHPWGLVGARHGRGR